MTDFIVFFNKVVLEVLINKRNGHGLWPCAHAMFPSCFRPSVLKASLLLVL